MIILRYLYLLFIQIVSRPLLFYTNGSFQNIYANKMNDKKSYTSMYYETMPNYSYRYKSCRDGSSENNNEVIISIVKS